MNTAEICLCFIKVTTFDLKESRNERERIFIEKIKAAHELFKFHFYGSEKGKPEAISSPSERPLLFSWYLGTLDVSCPVDLKFGFLFQKVGIWSDEKLVPLDIYFPDEKSEEKSNVLKSIEEIKGILLHGSEPEIC